MTDQDFDMSILKGGLKARGYDLRMWLIIVSVIPALVLAFIVGLQYGFGNVFYYHCGEAQCENPWHESYLNGINVEKTPPEILPYAHMKTFPQGFTVGVPEPPLMTWAYVLIVACPALALIINHIAYNRRKK